MSSSLSLPSLNARQKATGDALAGVLASLIALWVVYPIDVLKTRVQARSNSFGQDEDDEDDKEKKNKQHFLPQQPAWLSGLEYKSLHTACSSFCYFYLYSWIDSAWHNNKRRALPQNTNNSNDNISEHQTTSVATRLLLAAVAAMLNTCLTLPLDVVSARKQTLGLQYNTKVDSILLEKLRQLERQGEAEEQRRKKQNLQRKPSDVELFFVRLRSMLKRKLLHLTLYWKGLGPSLLLCTNPAIHYTVFDSMKQYILSSSYRTTTNNDNLTMSEAFVLGWVAKLLATLATYPLIRAKVLLMVTVTSPTASMWQCLKDEYQRDGLGGLYTGCNLQLVHTLLKSALLMMVRERVTQTAHRMVEAAAAKSLSAGPQPTTVRTPPAEK